MKENIRLFLAVIATMGLVCNISSQNVSAQTSASDPKMEAKLIADLEKYIQQNKLGTAEFNTKLARPAIAVTKTEIARIKAAWAKPGPEHDVLARRIKSADAAIVKGVKFPPGGGQHNQWYQCDACQVGLRTIDPHHHQCPKCNKIYSGFPYDNVLYTGQHSQNMLAAENAAWAWIISGDRKYADLAAQILSGYADRYLKYPMIAASVNDQSIDVEAEKLGRYKTAGRMFSQTLTEAAAVIPGLIAYDLIYNSPSLTSSQKQHIEKNLIRAVAANIMVAKNGKSNWQTWHNAALMYAGAVLGDASMLRLALLEKGNGFVDQMKISVMPEGMWYENSWGYHYYTLSAMTHLAEGSKRLGLDLYNFPPLRNMYLIGFDYQMADGSLPRFGDAVQDSPRRNPVNEKAYAVYEDERLLATLPSEPSWETIILGRDVTKNVPPVKLASKLIPGAGHAILATDGPGKLTAALTFGPYGGGHGHFDKLSFTFYGYGEELGVDPGRAASQAYRLPIHRDWYRATTGHNAVLVDGKSQLPAGGKCLAYNANSSYAAVTAEAGPAFENVTHTRFLLLAPSYALVVDELKPTDGKEHTYDWLYHNKGQSISSTLPQKNIILEPNPEGYAYLEDVIAHGVAGNQSFGLKFAGEKTSVYLTMAGQAGDEVFTANGLQKSVEDRVPMVIVRRKGQTVRFVTLLEPAPANGKPVVRSVSLSPDSQTAIVVHEGGEDRISFGENKLENFTVTSGSKVVLKK